MRKSALILLCVVAAACQRNEGGAKPRRVITTTIPADARDARIDTVVQPAPVFVDHSLLGTKLGADGKVAAETMTARPGETVYLTMVLRESPVGLKTRVVWSDPSAKKDIRTEEREMKGAKVVTYALDTKKLKPGKFHVEGYWGGNLAAEKDFEIVKGKK